jgi:hypothetical protein
LPTASFVATSRPSRGGLLSPSEAPCTASSTTSRCPSRKVERYGRATGTTPPAGMHDTVRGGSGRPACLRLSPAAPSATR